MANLSPHLVEFARKRQVKRRHGCLGNGGGDPAATGPAGGRELALGCRRQAGFTVLTRPADDSLLEPN